jgi:hypothetical protein
MMYADMKNNQQKIDMATHFDSRAMSFVVVCIYHTPYQRLHIESI